MSHETKTCKAWCKHGELGEGQSTHRATQAHLHEDDHLLERRERAQVDCCQSTDGRRADADEEAVHIADGVPSVARVENARQDEGDECAASCQPTSSPQTDKELTSIVSERDRS